MAEIKSFPVVRHLRAEPTSHVLRYRGGDLRAAGPGVAFWFRPINTTLAEVPIDDRELPFLFHARSADFQQLTVQGVITFRIADPGRIARRVDFSIDLDSGRWTQTPLEQVAGLLTQLAQQFVIDELVKLDIRAILTDGVALIRDRIAAGLAAEGALAELGLEIVAVRVAAVAPTSELEKALQQPTREAIQQQADEATFSRRALAVEKERAIADNELKNRIELARREEELVSREGVNARRRAELRALRDARTTDTVQAAELRAEAERTRIQASVPADVRLALALQDFAGQVGTIQSLTITPDLLSSLLTRVGAGAGNETAEVG